MFKDIPFNPQVAQFLPANKEVPVYSPKPPPKPQKKKTNTSPGKISKARALQIFGQTCFYCRCDIVAIKVLTFDHFIPVSKGGKHMLNLVPACFDCNQRKKDRMPLQHEVDRFNRYMKAYREKQTIDS